MACRVLKVSRSGYYEWRGCALAKRDWADVHLAKMIHDIHTNQLASVLWRAGRGVSGQVAEAGRCLNRAGPTPSIYKTPLSIAEMRTGAVWTGRGTRASSSCADSL